MSKDWKEYERNIAKALGAWTGCVFRRTPSSGAWGKQGQSRGSSIHDAARDFHGDIVAPPEAEFPFSVECKTYKKVELYLALYGKSPIYDWWFQCDGDARRVGLASMMVFKENYREPLVAISDLTWRQLGVIKDIHHLRRITLSYRTQKKAPRAIHMFNFSQFLAMAPYNIVKKVVRRTAI